MGYTFSPLGKGWDGVCSMMGRKNSGCSSATDWRADGGTLPEVRKFWLNGMLYTWAAVWTAFPFVHAFILSRCGSVVFIVWCGTLLTTLILICLIVARRDSPDSSSLSRLAF
jgi:hypothetical protein